MPGHGEDMPTKLGAVRTRTLGRTPRHRADGRQADLDWDGHQNERFVAELSPSCSPAPAGSPRVELGLLLYTVATGGTVLATAAP